MRGHSKPPVRFSPDGSHSPGVWVGPADVGATLEMHVEISSEFATKTEINPSCQLGSEQLMKLLGLGVPLCSASTTATSTPLRRTLPS